MLRFSGRLLRSCLGERLICRQGGGVRLTRVLGDVPRIERNKDITGTNAVPGPHANSENR